MAPIAARYTVPVALAFDPATGTIPDPGRHGRGHFSVNSRLWVRKMNRVVGRHSPDRPRRSETAGRLAVHTVKRRHASMGLMHGAAVGSTRPPRAQAELMFRLLQHEPLQRRHSFGPASGSRACARVHDTVSTSHYALGKGIIDKFENGAVHGTGHEDTGLKAGTSVIRCSHVERVVGVD